MIKQIFYALLVFVLTIVFCELFIEASHLGSYGTSEFYPDRGRGKLPNKDYVMFNEGFGIVHYNEYTYLGKSRPPEKPKNTIRIALMGDSFVEAFQVFQRHRFEVIAEGILSEKYPDTKIEILNFGHSNMDFAASYSYYKLFAEKFNPDMTLFLLAEYNLFPHYRDDLRPNTIIRNDSLVLDVNYPHAAIASHTRTKFLAQNFSLMYMLNKGLGKSSRQKAQVVFGKFFNWFSTEPTRKPPIGEYYKERHPVTEKIVETLDPDKVAFVSRHWDPLPKIFKSVCLDNGFEYLDISPVMQEMKKKGNDPYEWKATNKSGHWNQKGHQVAGEELARFIGALIEKKGLRNNP